MGEETIEKFYPALEYEFLTFSKLVYILRKTSEHVRMDVPRFGSFKLRIISQNELHRQSSMEVPKNTHTCTTHTTFTQHNQNDDATTPTPRRTSQLRISIKTW